MYRLWVWCFRCDTVCSCCVLFVGVLGCAKLWCVGVLDVCFVCLSDVLAPECVVACVCDSVC